MVRYVLEKNCNFASSAISLHFLAIAALPFSILNVYIYFTLKLLIFLLSGPGKGPDVGFMNRKARMEMQSVTSFTRLSWEGGHIT